MDSRGNRALMKCIIFDCDGVLVDSEISTTTHFIKHLHDLGYQISTEDAIKKFTDPSGPDPKSLI